MIAVPIHTAIVVTTDLTMGTAIMTKSTIILHLPIRQLAIANIVFIEAMHVIEALGVHVTATTVGHIRHHILIFSIVHPIATAAVLVFVAVYYLDVCQLGRSIDVLMTIPAVEHAFISATIVISHTVSVLVSIKTHLAVIRTTVNLLVKFQSPQ
jgi:hypothetical protein